MTRMVVPGIVLSGGRSSRMGRPKALLPAGAETFVGRIVRTLRAGGVGELLVVAPTADLAARIGAALAAHAAPPRIVVNPDPARGQLSSLLVGLEVLDPRGEAPPGEDRRRVDAVLMTLVDDACATSSEARHRESLVGFKGYCRVRSTGEIIAEIDEAAGRRRIA